MNQFKIQNKKSVCGVGIFPVLDGLEVQNSQKSTVKTVLY